ncbi:MAG TPA: hypothetical protein VJU80_04875 [Solirubrobacteraceae bacterium]|nr:hypothetical protein [Solirubrobacteraceae bacterium]
MIAQPTPAPWPPEVVAHLASSVPDWLQILAAAGGALGGIAGLVGPIAAFAAVRAANTSRTQA